MCLYVASKRLTAKEDMTVYKVISRGGVPPFFCFRYERGKTYKTSMRKKPVALWTQKSLLRDYVVDQGFHACVKRSDAVAMFEGFYGMVVRPFIIPKGAHYYLGSDGSIVSDQIRYPAARKRKPVTA